MNIIAFIAIGLALGTLVLGPFLIGEERRPYTAVSYIAELIESSIFVALAGRVLGWW